MTSARSWGLSIWIAMAGLLGCGGARPESTEPVETERPTAAPDAEGEPRVQSVLIGDFGESRQPQPEVPPAAPSRPEATEVAPPDFPRPSALATASALYAPIATLQIRADRPYETTRELVTALRSEIRRADSLTAEIDQHCTDIVAREPNQRGECDTLRAV